MSDLNGKVAFVTGGSNGIGAASVKTLAAHGASVIIGYNSGEGRARDLVMSLPGTGHDVQQLLLEDSTSISSAAGAIGTKYGKLDILVNSAGFTKPVPHVNLEGLDDVLFDTIMMANVRGVFSTIRAFAPLLRAAGDAVIVNVSSIAAFTGSGSNVAYCASKAALDTMSISLARVLGPEIRVLCVSPGAVATDFVAGRSRADLEKAASVTPLSESSKRRMSLMRFLRASYYSRRQRVPALSWMGGDISSIARQEMSRWSDVMEICRETIG